jgi:hypothetical protein
MRLILTALIFLAGMLDLFVGASFLFSPATTGPQFGLNPIGHEGLAVLRADFTAFFWVAAGCMFWGAWRRNADLLLVPAAIFGVAFAVRAVSLGIDGSYDAAPVKMGVEAFHIVLLIAAWRLLPHHTITQIAEITA